MASIDGKIVCENTLDARLDVAFRKKLPEVRIALVLHLFTIFCSLKLQCFDEIGVIC